MVVNLRIAFNASSGWSRDRTTFVLLWSFQLQTPLRSPDRCWGGEMNEIWMKNDMVWSKSNFETFVADAVLRLIRQSWPAGFELDLMSRVHGHESSRRSGDLTTARASKVNFETFVADAVWKSIRQSWPAGFELNLMGRFHGHESSRRSGDLATARGFESWFWGFCRRRCFEVDSTVLASGFWVGFSESISRSWVESQVGRPCDSAGFELDLVSRFHGHESSRRSGDLATARGFLWCLLVAMKMF